QIEYAEAPGSHRPIPPPSQGEARWGSLPQAPAPDAPPASLGLDPRATRQATMPRRADHKPPPQSSPQGGEYLPVGLMRSNPELDLTLPLEGRASKARPTGRSDAREGDAPLTNVIPAKAGTSVRQGFPVHG